jgi:hypothetical protein
MSKRLSERTAGVKKKTGSATAKVSKSVKGKVKAPVKMVSATKVSAKKAKTAHPTRTGFMWKILEQKQKALQQNQGPGKHPFAHADGSSASGSTHGQKGHGRFNGPRRRAA